MFRYIYFLIFALIFVACSSRTDNSKSTEQEVYYSQEHAGDAITPTIEESTSLKNSEEVSNFQISERKLIKEGSIRFETENIEKTRRGIEKMTKDNRGYISRENMYDYGEEKLYEMVVRIPTNAFDNFVQNVSNLVVNLDSKDINVKDVTEEYIDVESRIKAKKEILNRYTEMLKQAKNVSEMLDIEREIGKIQVELETYQGRLKYLQNQVTFSTLTITFYEHKSVEFGFFKKLGKAFVSGWKGLSWFLIYIFYLWPLWLILGISIWTVLYYIKKKKKNLSK